MNLFFDEATHVYSLDGQNIPAGKSKKVICHEYH
jgi:hypothetical protein